MTGPGPIDTIRAALDNHARDPWAALAALTEVEHQLAAVNEVREYGLKPGGLLDLINKKAAAETALAEAKSECDKAVHNAGIFMEQHRQAREAAERRANDALNGLAMAAGELERERQLTNDLADALREIVDWLGPDSPRAERARAALDRHTRGAVT